MAGNDNDYSSNVQDGLEWLVMDGVEYLAYPYNGCSVCSTTEERLPFFYEVSMKESLKGKKRKYPINNNMSRNSCTDVSLSCISDIMKHLTDHIKSSKDSDCPAQSFSEINVTEPKTHDLERLINTVEFYVSSLKGKLQQYKGKEYHQSRGGTLEPLDTITEGREDEPDPENDETAMSDDEIESGGGETTRVINTSSREASVVRNEPSRAGTEVRSISSIKSKSKNCSPVKVRGNETMSRYQESELSSEESESSGEESESSDFESSKSSDEELSKVKKSSECKQGIETKRREQSQSKVINYLRDTDNSYAELEIHSGVDGSSSIKGRINIRKHHFSDNKLEDDRSKDTEEQHPSEKRRCFDPEESIWLTAPEHGENYPARGSQRSVESETTESSLYETAKEISSQASEVLFNSSGSESP